MGSFRSQWELLLVFEFSICSSDERLSSLVSVWLSFEILFIGDRSEIYYAELNIFMCFTLDELSVVSYWLAYLTNKAPQ